MDQLFNNYKNDNLTLQEKKQLITFLVDHYFNKTRFDVSDNNLLNTLNGTYLVEMLSEYVFNHDMYEFPEIKKKFILNFMIEKAMRLEGVPGTRNDTELSNINEAIRNFKPPKRKANEEEKTELSKKIKTIEKQHDCPICTKDLKNNVVTLQCGHMFHKNCINQWTKTSDTCPICRNPNTIQPVNVLENSQATDDGSGILINDEEPEVNSFGKRKRLSDLMYLMHLNTKLRKVGRRNGN
jgi:hypothetical protein